MPQVHQWLVKQGRLGMSASAERVLLEVDPEGSESCVLTPRDAAEVASILTEHARILWQQSAQAHEYEPSVRELTEMEYQWQTQSGLLTVLLSPEQPEMAVKYAGANPCQLSVAEAVEVVQVIERLLSRLAHRAVSTPPASEPQAEVAPKRPWWKIW